MVAAAAVAAAGAVSLRGADDEPSARSAFERSDPPDTTASTAAIETLDAAGIAARFGDAVMRVEVSGCGVEGSGTAFAIDEHHLVTNWHVVNVDTEPELVDRHGRRITGQVVGWSQDPDVAVIAVEEPQSVTLEFAATDDLSEGERLVTLGYPVPARDFSVTDSGIVSFQKRGGQRVAIRSDGAVDRGNSGGPALTLRGEVAGVVTEMADNSDGLQLVPLMFTHDALGASIASALQSSARPVVDCADAGFIGALPPGWGGAYTYGDDAYLDELWDACAAGDMAACDELYWITPVGSAYEAFGSTCGEQSGETFGGCDSATAPATDAYSYGDDSYFDGLWDLCSGGDLDACDDLYMQSPLYSDYEWFGTTCGERRGPTYGGCATPPALPPPTAPAPLPPVVVPPPPVTSPPPQVAYDYGDDAYLDNLWDGCGAGDLDACDELYIVSPIDSQYERYGSTCGNRSGESYGGCARSAPAPPPAPSSSFADLRAACAAGDMTACDDLYWQTPVGSDDEHFGSTCGGRSGQTYGGCA
jgi:S1-C subfamily serine protease